MSTRIRLNPEDLNVDGFHTTDEPEVSVAAAAGTWNDATAGCCAPQQVDPTTVLVITYWYLWF